MWRWELTVGVDVPAVVDVLAEVADDAVEEERIAARARVAVPVDEREERVGGAVHRRGGGGGAERGGGGRAGREMDPGDAVPPGVAPLTPAPLTEQDRKVLDKLEHDFPSNT